MKPDSDVPPIPRIGVVFLALLTVTGMSPAADGAMAPDGRHVLVLYAADGPDRDGNGDPDSLDAARYSAARRTVPAENLLALKLARGGDKRRRWTYRDAFERILKPVSAKLASIDVDGNRLSERICYILICPDVPTEMVAVPPVPKTEKSWFRKIRRRSIDSYLISVDANVRMGIDEETGFPPPRATGVVGHGPRDMALPIDGKVGPGATRRHFRKLRHQGLVDFYLVTRLGNSLQTARDMLDGALYAERHLRLPGPDEAAAIRPSIWLDMKYKFAGDHVAAMSRAVAVVQGVAGSPFAGRRGLNRVWPLVIDTAPSEIGSGKPAHRPTVTAVIAPGGVDKAGVTLKGPRSLGRRRKDVPTVLYFPPRCKVACYKPQPPRPKTPVTQPAGKPAETKPSPPTPVATATVVGIDPGKNRLLLDSTEGFQPGHTVKYVWDGQFPTRDCFLFYGFYGLGRFEDVRQFPPGAIGVHVDSSCGRWARGAMSRGIAATFGVTMEPLSSGIPHGDLMLLALGRGYDWAESAYGALRLAQRWTGLVYGDPLYAPFRSRQIVDKTPPAIGRVTVKRAGPGAMTITAQLKGETDEQRADVALFRLDYGLTTDYGQRIDFSDWPEPLNGTNVKGRRFGYSRHVRWKLKGLKMGKTYHYRVTARDPAWLVTAAPDATFKTFKPPMYIGIRRPHLTLGAPDKPLSASSGHATGGRLPFPRTQRQAPRPRRPADVSDLSPSELPPLHLRRLLSVVLYRQGGVSLLQVVPPPWGGPCRRRP